MAAPVDTPQLPSLLNGYAVRPTWQVAGVDYAVGYGSTSLTDWESISQPGVTVNTSTNTVTITGNNVTLSGIDFSLHGGAQVVVSGNNDTITKSDFLYGTTMASDADIFLVNQIAGSNLTLSYNVINGNGPALGSSASNQSSLISTSGTGTFTLEYNLLENFNQHALEASNSTENIVYQYNLIYNGGSGAPGAHLNYLQFGSGTYTATVEFNTTYQPTVPVSGGEGFQFYNNGSGSVTGTLAYNTMIYGPDGEGLVHVPGPGETKVSVYDNYIDKKGGATFFYNDPNASDTYSGDINMVTGTLIDASDTPSNSNPTTPGTKLNSIIESPASGDLNAGKTVTLTLNLSEAVTVTGGTPTLTLNDGGTATYSGGSGSNALTFNYTVTAGQNTSALAATAVNLNSATVIDGAGNAANLSLSGLTQSGPQIDTTTSTGSGTTQSGSSGATSTGSSGSTLTAPTISSFSPDNGEAGGGYTSSDVLTVNGTAAANSKVEVFNESKQLGTANVNGSGAWSYTTPTLSDGTQSFTAKDVNAAGNVSAASAALTVTVVSAATLTQAGSTYDVSTPASDPVLKYQGADVTAGQFGTWVPFAAILTASGYDVAWKESNANEYTVWTTDTNGNYTGNLIGAVAGNSTTWELLAPIFGAASSPTTKVIQTDGLTSLTEVGNQFYVNASGSDSALKYNNAAVTAGQFGAWTPIGAVQTTSGYDVAWKNTASGQYTVWTTNSNGNYTGNLIGTVSGTSTALEALEPIFDQNLNGDGKLTSTVIQTDGSTKLTKVADQVSSAYYLNSANGSGPALKYQSVDVTGGEFGGWTPIGAVQTASGYDVAWKNTANGQYTVWNTDSNGNYTGNLIGAVSGTSTALEFLEFIFGRDLNGDGVIGIYAAPNAALKISSSLAGSSGTTTIGAGATLEIAAADSASITFQATTGTLRLDQASTFSGQIFGFKGNGSLSGSDHIDLTSIKYSSIKDSYTGGVLTVTDGSGDTAKLNFNGSYTLANFKFASDGSGGTVVYDPPVTTPSSGQNTAGGGPVLPSATTVTGETPDLTAAIAGPVEPSAGPSISGFGAKDNTDNLPDLAFNAQSTLGYLPDGNRTAGTLSLADGIHSANIGLLGNYMASIFAMGSVNHGGTTTVAEIVQPNDHSVLSNPHHA